METEYPSPQSELNMDLKITSVSCHPNDILVKFQGKYLSDCDLDYHILQNEIQLVTKAKANAVIGEFCLVQDKPFGTWSRGKILDKIGEIIEVLLIDQGNVVKVSGSYVVSASGDLFTLPPKVVNGILCNILPTGEKWTARAVNYFTSLTRLQIKGQVQTVLPHEVVLLEIPKVISHAMELNVAKYVDSNSFCFLVEIIHKFPVSYNWKQMPDLLQQKKIHSDFSLSLCDNPPRFLKILDHLKPRLSLGTKEKVRISAVVSPDKFYCRLLSSEEELSSLTSAMTSHYETIDTEENSMLDYFGVLCAAKRKDRLWHRGVIHKLISAKEMRVWFMDIGSYETVPSIYVQKLKPEYLSLPMMTVPCSLHAVGDNNECNRKIQLLQIKQGLLGHIVIAHISQFSSEDNLYYVTLSEKDCEINLDRPLSNHPVPTTSTITYLDINNAVTTETEEKSNTSLVTAVSEKENDIVETISYKTIQMEVDSVYVVFVEYVINPSNFWIKTDDCHNEFSAMMDDITKLYDSCGPTEKVLEDPAPGQLCCALYAKDEHYYRAVVTGVDDLKVVVYFLDFGNTDTVDCQNVKTLLPQFTDLPALAMGCMLAHTCPLEDVWVKSANDYFKDLVSDKPLFCHVLAKQKYQYVVDIRDSESSENSNISALMVQAGFAEYWKIDLHPAIPDTQRSSRQKTMKPEKPSSQKSYIFIENGGSKIPTRMTNSVKEIKPLEKSSESSETWEYALSTVHPIGYKQYVFKPGTKLDVNVSHANTPSDFWCQQLARSSELSELMADLQKHYSTCDRVYRCGQIACVAKRPCNGIFYRASVTAHVSRKEVDVLFVDYGFAERVPLSELREIESQFLKVEGQAFRCSLNIAIAPARHDTWTSGACKDFKRFVQVDSGSFKCTIQALCSDLIGLYNSVKLETPGGDACQYLVDQGHAVFSRDNIQSSNLHTFCYSDFDIKIWQEQQVYITCVYNSGIFYCQLARNTSVIDALMMNLSKITPVNGRRKNGLCLVKYVEDGNYYRAMVHPADSSSCFRAFFVDFGDSQIVSDNEMFPVPNDAVDLMYVPMQGIRCSFSGLKVNVITPEVKKWFEDHYIGKPLTAVVVSKNNDGHLELDLYDERVLVNERIIELLGEGSHSERPEKLAKPNGKCLENGNANVTIVKSKSIENKSAKPRETVSLLAAEENGTLTRRGERQVKKGLGPDNDSDSEMSNQRLDLDENAQKSKTKSYGCVPLATPVETPMQTLASCRDLPQKNIEPGTTHSVYVSHINSPSDFYIQLADHEKKILCVVEDLNKETISFQDVTRGCLTTGNLVVARYPEDQAFYRAVIKEVRENHACEVEFIDYGNTAVVDFANVFSLPNNFLTIPRLSIRAYLDGLEELHTDGEWNEKVACGFSETVNSTSLNCSFLSVSNSQWKVSLTDGGKSVANGLLESLKTASCQKSAETKELPKVSKDNQNIGESPQATNPKKATNVFCRIEDHQIPSQCFKPSQLEKVKNIYVPGSGIFFVTLMRNSQESKLSSLISASFRAGSGRLQIKNITVGMACLAKSGKMQKWLRAVVKKVFPLKKMLVFFMDHGTSETISMHNTKVLTGDLLRVPKQAVPCKWAWEKNGDYALFVEEILSRKEMNIDVLFLDFLTSDGAWKVDFLISGVLLMEHLNSPDSNKMNLQETCSNSGAATLPRSIFSIPACEVQLLRFYAGFVTAAQDPSHFCVQLDDRLDAINNLSQLMEGLPDQILSLPPSLLCRGSPCLLKCFAGEEWCRAEILNVSNYSILLDIIDHGVFKQVSYSDQCKLKMIPKELADLPPLMHRCTLHGVIPRDGAHWSVEAIAFFLDFVQTQNTSIQFIKRCPDRVFDVRVCGKDHESLTYQLVSKELARNIDGNDNVVNSVMPNITLKPCAGVEKDPYRGKSEVSSSRKCSGTLKGKSNPVAHGAIRKVITCRTDKTKILPVSEQQRDTPHSTSYNQGNQNSEHSAKI